MLRQIFPHKKLWIENWGLIKIKKQISYIFKYKRPSTFMNKFYNKTNKVTDIFSFQKFHFVSHYFWQATQKTKWEFLRNTLGIICKYIPQNKTPLHPFPQVLNIEATDVPSQLGASSPSIHIIKPNTLEWVCIVKCDSYMTNTLFSTPFMSLAPQHVYLLPGFHD